MLTKKSPKVAIFFVCEKCDYKCSKQSDYAKHCSTRKHILLTRSEKSLTEKSPVHICKQCNKEYQSKQGLWSHSKKCHSNISNELILVPNDDVSENKPIKNYIMKLVEQNIQLVEQNTELKNMFIQQTTELHEKIDTLSEKPMQVSTINNNNIQNNKTINNFNLMVFLQERCKDALNMSQFIDTLEINPQSVEYTGTHGYVNGITKIFMDGLNQLDIHERPIHCTDLKRETLYIKENDKWEKDNDDKSKFKDVLATVVNRNVAQVKHWEEENPRCKIPETDEYEFYFVIARQSLGGGNYDVTVRNNDRILRAIAGKVYLDKKTKSIK
jgi:hypothetical protein